jgi:hypothetical protein
MVGVFLTPFKKLIVVCCVSRDASSVWEIRILAFNAVVFTSWIRTKVVRLAAVTVGPVSRRLTVLTA